MKSKILKLGTIFLLFLFIGAGCEKDTDDGEIRLEYKSCPCENETEPIGNSALDTIFLFDNTVTSYDKMLELSLDGNCSEFFSYNKESDSTILQAWCGSMYSVGYCCNFPTIVDDWLIPEEGIIISYAADVFEVCEPGITPTNYSYHNIILTYLKKLEE